MARLQVILTLDVADKSAAASKLQQLRILLSGTGVKLSASLLDMLQKPEEQ